MLSLLSILFVALMLPGLIARTRARLSGRRGVPFDKHLGQLGVLLRKEPIYSSVSGFVTRLAPVVSLGAVLTAALLLPVGGFGALFSFRGDLVLFCYLLALSRLALILGAMEAGSSFQGMGASREALYGAFAEPVLFLILGTLALLSGQSSFAGVFNQAGDGSQWLIVISLLLYVVFRLTLIESGRVPVDDPKTHLELTMIHEAMVLDYGGFDLGLIVFASWVKMALLALIGASVLASALWYAAAPVIFLALLFGLMIGALESFTARSRLSRNTTYIFTTLAIAFVVFVVAFLMVRNITIA